MGECTCHCNCTYGAKLSKLFLFSALAEAACGVSVSFTHIVIIIIGNTLFLDEAHLLTNKSNTYASHIEDCLVFSYLH